MSALFHGKTRWLLAGATLSLLAGCAAGGRITPGETGCPMNFTMTCDAERHGAETTLARCRCLRHSDINAVLDRY